jgi:hypothetical protein
MEYAEKFCAFIMTREEQDRILNPEKGISFGAALGNIKGSLAKSGANLGKLVQLEGLGDAGEEFHPRATNEEEQTLAKELVCKCLMLLKILVEFEIAQFPKEKKVRNILKQDEWLNFSLTNIGTIEIIDENRELQKVKKDSILWRKKWVDFWRIFS